MRLTKRRRDSRAAINMTPMIDIVFLLLVFFMTVSQVSEINKEEIPLPQQKGAEEQKPSLMIVNVTRQGDMVVSGMKVSKLQFMALVDQEINRYEDPSLVQVVIRADRSGTSKTVNEIVTALTRLNVNRIRIAVQAP